MPSVQTLICYSFSLHSTFLYLCLCCKASINQSYMFEWNGIRKTPWTGFSNYQVLIGLAKLPKRTSQWHRSFLQWIEHSVCIWTNAVKMKLNLWNILLNNDEQCTDAWEKVTLVHAQTFISNSENHPAVSTFWIKNWQLHQTRSLIKPLTSQSFRLSLQAWL